MIFWDNNILNSVIVQGLEGYVFLSGDLIVGGIGSYHNA